MLEGTSARLALAKTLRDLGTAQRAFGRAAASRDPLKRAYELATECGVTVVAREAKDELVASGARPRRSGQAGVDAVTGRGRRVAVMASDRAINHRIAGGAVTVEEHRRVAAQHLSQARCRRPNGAWRGARTNARLSPP